MSFTSSHTLTNWGLFTGLAGGNCGVVDLFRSDPNDVLSSAVTISVQDGDELQMTIAFEFRISPYGVEADTLALNIDGTETTPAAQSTFYGDSNGDYEQAFNAWRPNLTAANSNPRQGVSTLSASNLSNTTGGTALLEGLSISQDNLEAYTTGTYTRVTTYTFTTAQSNGDIWGFCLGQGPNTGGFKTVFDSPITKTALQELTAVFTKTWDRA
jgi:hypothetical protein